MQSNGCHYHLNFNSSSDCGTLFYCRTIMLRNNLAAGQVVPQRRPPPPPPPPRPIQQQTATQRPPKPPPNPKPSRLQETIYELPADNDVVKDGPFEVAAGSLSAESQFDEQLHRNYVTSSARSTWDEDNSPEGHLGWSDSSEQPLPPVPL